MLETETLTHGSADVSHDEFGDILTIMATPLYSKMSLFIIYSFLIYKVVLPCRANMSRVIINKE
jgi:hypothetical protein